MKDEIEINGEIYVKKDKEEKAWKEKLRWTDYGDVIRFEPGVKAVAIPDSGVKDEYSFEGIAFLLLDATGYPFEVAKGFWNGYIETNNFEITGEAISDVKVMKDER